MVVEKPMTFEPGELLVRHNTTVTCPTCATEFSLERGFVKKALEKLAEASAGAISAMREAERAAVADARAIAEYRAGRACHPLQPFVEWSACDATAHRLGSVLIAGCRDAQSARQLGYVPAHGLGAALEMARGRGAERIGYLLAPPYFPLVVGPT